VERKKVRDKEKDWYRGKRCWRIALLQGICAKKKKKKKAPINQHRKKHQWQHICE